MCHAKNAICLQINMAVQTQYAQGCEGEFGGCIALGWHFFANSCCAAEYFTVIWQFMSPCFVCFHSLEDFYFITIMSSSVLASEDPECNLSSSSDSHTPQRQPLRFWLNEPTPAVPSDAKCCTIFHAFSRPFLLQLSVSSSEQACLLPAKAIIYITALKRKHNHCFLWRNQAAVYNRSNMFLLCLFLNNASGIATEGWWVGEWNDANEMAKNSAAVPPEEFQIFFTSQKESNI